MAEGMDKYDESRESFIRENKVYIFSRFDEKISKLLPDLEKLIMQEKDMKDANIEFVINSPGGYTNELFGLLSYVEMAKQLGIKIITRVIGEASSCASMLAASGDERYMFKYGYHLIHYGYSGTASCSNPEEAERVAAFNKDHFAKVVDIYGRYSKIKKDKIRQLLRSDLLFLDAATCLKYGLCDYVYG